MLDTLVYLRRETDVWFELTTLLIPGENDSDAELHAMILAATGFRRIAQVADTAWVQVNRARQLVLPVPGRVAETLGVDVPVIEDTPAGQVIRARGANDDKGQLYAHIMAIEAWREAGGVPFVFNTIGVDDGIAMGHDGMLYSLPSRDLIADSVEYMVNAHCADAMVCISNCDKITPGMLNAAMRSGLSQIRIANVRPPNMSAR